MSLTVAKVQEIFKPLTQPGKKTDFFTHVAEDVDWEILGTSEVSHHYHSKRDFIKVAFGRIGRVLVEPATFHIDNIIVIGHTAIVEMNSTGKGLNGKPYNNTYCWIVTFKDHMIVKVRAYLDTLLVNQHLRPEQFSE